MSQYGLALITPATAERALTYATAHPEAFAYVTRYAARVARRVEYDLDTADGMANLISLLVPSFLARPDETDRKALRRAIRGATRKVRAAVIRDKDASLPVDFTEDESRGLLTKHAPDPASAYAVGYLDLIAQSLLHVGNLDDREALRQAVVAIRHGERATFTTRQTPRTTARRIARALAEVQYLEPRILTDPYGDGTGERKRTIGHTPIRWEDRPRGPRPAGMTINGRPPMPMSERPAQVPAWMTPGGTAKPDVGAVVTTRYVDSGTPGLDVTALSVTGPDGSQWLPTRYVTGWTREDTRRLSAALARPESLTDPLTHVERHLAAPRHGTPKKPSPRARSRVGSTGPTVPAYGMTR